MRRGWLQRVTRLCKGGEDPVNWQTEGRSRKSLLSCDRIESDSEELASEEGQADGVCNVSLLPISLAPIRLPTKGRFGGVDNRIRTSEWGLQRFLVPYFACPHSFANEGSVRRS